MLGHAGYEIRLLLGDFSDPIFIACLRFLALDGCLYATLFFIIVHRFSIGLRLWVAPGPFQPRDLVFCSGTQWLPDEERHLA